MKTLLLLLCLFIYSADIYAQDLRKIPRPQRDSILLAKSKAVILKYGEKEYWEHCLPPVITNYICHFNKEYEGRLLYRILYPYDTTLYIFYSPWCAKVEIWGDTGKVFGVSFGNGFGYSVEKMERKNSPFTKMKFTCASRPELEREWERKRLEQEKAMEPARKLFNERMKKEAEEWRKKLAEIIRQDSIEYEKKKLLEDEAKKKKRRKK